MIWHTLYSEISNYCHGKKMKVILDTDKSHYWIGRISIDSTKENKFHSIYEINLDADPYKYEVLSSLDDWLWDPFNFEYDIIREYGHIVVKGSRTITLVGSALPCIPTITTNDDLLLECGGKTYNLKKGTQKLYSLTLLNKEYVFTFTGTGTVSIDIRGGSL